MQAKVKNDVVKEKTFFASSEFRRLLLNVS